MLLGPVDMYVNQAIPEAVWEAFDALPSETLPRKAARPVRRLSALAQALSRDGLRADARKDAFQKLFAKLNGLLAQHKEKVAATSKGILKVEGETLVARVVGGEVREQETFVEAADEQSVEADFKAACRALTADLARKYADHLAIGDEDDDGLFDAHVKVAALAQVYGVADELDREADELGKKWFGEYRVAIKGLTDERRAVYDEIKGMSLKTEVIEIKRAPRPHRGDRERRRQQAGDPDRTPHVRPRRQLPHRLAEPVGNRGSRQGDGTAPVSWPGIGTLHARPATPLRSLTRTPKATGAECAPTSSSSTATART